MEIADILKILEDLNISTQIRPSAIRVAKALDKINTEDTTITIEQLQRTIREEGSLAEIYHFGRRRYEIRQRRLSEEEITTIIQTVARDIYTYADKGLTEVAEAITEAIPAIIVAAREMKAITEGSEIVPHPREENEIGIIPIIPQFIKYTASPDTTHPAYTEYNNPNKWLITFKVDEKGNPQPTYLLGTETGYWKPPRQQGERFTIVIIGFLRYTTRGNNNEITQIHIESEGESGYTTAVSESYNVPDKVDYDTIYRFYRTPILILSPERGGIKLEVLATEEVTEKVPLIGYIFYEQPMLKTIKIIK